MSLSPLVARRRRRAAALCAALALLCAAAAVRLAFRSPEKGPAVLTDTGDPAETVALFFNALCLHDWQRASGYVRGEPELELSAAPESEAEQALWYAFLLSWSWEVDRGGKTDPLHAWETVRFTALRPDAVTRGLDGDVQAILARWVDEARTENEIYDETGGYRQSVVDKAVLEALAVRLAAPEDYRITTVLTLQLLYENGGWVILPEESLWNALSGVPEGGAA